MRMDPYIHVGKIELPSPDEFLDMRIRASMVPVIFRPGPVLAPLQIPELPEPPKPVPTPIRLYCDDLSHRLMYWNLQRKRAHKARNWPRFQVAYARENELMAEAIRFLDERTVPAGKQMRKHPKLPRRRNGKV